MARAAAFDIARPAVLPLSQVAARRPGTMSRRFGVPKKVRPAQQARSRATLERILDATLPLLDGRDFENVPVTEITGAAEISASSLYARFPTKATCWRRSRASSRSGCCARG